MENNTIWYLCKICNQSIPLDDYNFHLLYCNGKIIKCSMCKNDVEKALFKDHFSAHILNDELERNEILEMNDNFFLLDDIENNEQNNEEQKNENNIPIVEERKDEQLNEVNYDNIPDVNDQNNNNINENLIDIEERRQEKFERNKKKYEEYSISHSKKEESLVEILFSDNKVTDKAAKILGKGLLKLGEVALFAGEKLINKRKDSASKIEDEKKERELELLISLLPVTKIIYRAEVPSEQCFICKRSYFIGEEITILPCADTFHNRCLVSSLKHATSCPKCKTKISKKSFIGI